MSITALFELLAAITAIIGAVFLFDQQLHRPRPYKLMWTLGLLFYGIAAAAAFAGAAGEWTVASYKVWYFFGGILTAAYLGFGTLYLLGPRRLAHVVAIVGGIISIYALIRIVSFPVSAATASHIAASTTAQVTDVSHFKVLPVDMEVAAIVMNIPGSILLFGGALYSAWRFIRSRTQAYRVVSMVFIAGGALLLSVTTGLQRLGYSDLAAFGEFAGALCLIGGMLVSHDVFSVFRIPFTSIVVHARKINSEAPQASLPSHATD